MGSNNTEFVTMTIHELKYSNTNTYLIEGDRGRILFDAGWAGTFPAFYKTKLLIILPDTDIYRMIEEKTVEIYGISRLRPTTDGKGIRTLICTYGCPLKCKYCINPLSWNGKGKPKTYTLEGLYDAVKLDRLYWQATDGGITFGGGEPLLQAQRIREFIDTFCDGIREILQAYVWI